MNCDPPIFPSPDDELYRPVRLEERVHALRPLDGAGLKRWRVRTKSSDQPIRLRVMAALAALDPGEDGLDFTRLKGLTGATDGNLGAHLDHLARAGYVEVTKAFVARRLVDDRQASAAGRRAFARHVAFLKGIIAGT